MSQMPSFTIITPSLNLGQFLEQTLCSVLDQEYPNLQYLVVDGGSSDSSLSTLSRYSDRLSWWREPCDDPGEAINAALPHARGELIGILGSDDLYLPGALHAVAKRWQSGGQPSWLASHCRKIEMLDQPAGYLYAQAPRSLRRHLTQQQGLLPLAGTFFHRALLERAGPFATDLGLAFHHEMSCWLLAQGHRPTILPLLTAAKREHPSSLGAMNPLNQGQAYIAAAERHAHRLPRQQRQTLIQQCRQRRRIYQLARAETAQDGECWRYWQRRLRHPHWLAEARYRRRLLDEAQPSPGKPTVRPAA